MTFEKARESFPGLKDKVFLDAACVSLVPRQAAEGISEFLNMTMMCGAEDASRHHIAMDEMRSEAVAEAARLLNTRKENIALVESTTHGLNVAAGAIPVGRGDNVLIADTEFLQVAIPWSKKRKSAGIGIKPVRSRRDGALAIDDFEAAMDSKTRVVCVSSVQWNSGFRIDMEELSSLCRLNGVWLVVDAIQEMGAMQIDLSSQPADFLTAGGHKWLNAPFGCGILFVSDRAVQELNPSSYGYLALEEPDGGWAEYFRTPDITPYRDYRFPQTAKKFEIGGTANYPGAVGLSRSLKLINDLGISNIEKHIRDLTELLHTELPKIGARVVSDRHPGARSGITVFRYYDTPKEDLALLNRLLKERIFLAIRYTSNVGGIRVSTHFYNNEDDVMKLVAALRKCT